MWVCWKLRAFLGSPVRGKHQSVSQENVWRGGALKPGSRTPESAYVAVSSARDKMQVGGSKKETKNNFLKC